MLTYENCSRDNPVGLIFCEFCGQRLSESDDSKTIAERNIQMPTLLSDLDEEATSISHKTLENAILLIVCGSRGPVSMQLIPRSQPYVIGRSDQTQDVDIDLKSHGAFHLGISCHHASVFYHSDTWWIQDMGSTNKTYLNETLLDSQSPTELKHGTHLRLGQLLIFVRSLHN